MNFATHYQCTLCNKLYDIKEDIYTCPSCGEKGILDVIYDYKAMSKVVTKDYLLHNKNHSIWRYLPMMTLEKGDYFRSLHVGWTPLYRSNNMGPEIGLSNLYIKDEGVNPTGSLKDRASIVAAYKACNSGYKVIACSSTGNAASSLAGNASRLGLQSVIFVPERVPIGKLNQLLAYGATVVKVKGDYKKTFQLSKEAINHFGWYNRNAAINPHLVEGKKTVAYEIYEQLGYVLPDWVAVSVGDGCTIGGVYKGFYDLQQLGLTKKVPKILGVQSIETAPFYKAFINHTEIEEQEENSLADSISVGIPRNPVKGMNAVIKSGGVYTAVSDQMILDTMKYLGSTEGIFGEPAGVTATAGVMKAVQEGIILPTETVVTIMTGNGLKDPINAEKAVGKATAINPSLEELKVFLQNKQRGEIDE